MTDQFDMNTWVKTYKDAFSSFGQAQQDGFRVLERFARFHYTVAGDVLEAGIAQAKAAMTPKAVTGPNMVAELIQRQAELSTELGEKLQARAEEFSAMAADAQQSVNGLARQAATRATRAANAAQATAARVTRVKRVTRGTRGKRKAS